jgi:hypothetical protein
VLGLVLLVSGPSSVAWPVVPELTDDRRLNTARTMSVHVKPHPHANGTAAAKAPIGKMTNSLTTMPLGAGWQQHRF